MELPLFEEVGELTRSLVATGTGAVRFRAHRRGVKVWLDADAPGRCHFEAQLIPRHLVDGEPGAAIEVGFHAEHPDLRRNDEVIAVMVAAAGRWRSELGPAAEVGPFLGRPEDWRRVSETWTDVDPDDPELSFALAARLADYIDLLSPHVPAGT